MDTIEIWDRNGLFQVQYLQPLNKTQSCKQMRAVVNSSSRVERRIKQPYGSETVAH